MSNVFAHPIEMLGTSAPSHCHSPTRRGKEKGTYVDELELFLLQPGKRERGRMGVSGGCTFSGMHGLRRSRQILPRLNDAREMSFELMALGQRRQRNSGRLACAGCRGRISMMGGKERLREGRFRRFIVPLGTFLPPGRVRIGCRAASTRKKAQSRRCLSVCRTLQGNQRKMRRRGS